VLKSNTTTITKHKTSPLVIGCDQNSWQGNKVSFRSYYHLIGYKGIIKSRTLFGVEKESIAGAGLEQELLNGP